MKSIKNQSGYALLVVLLMVVLFMGLAATFMAGSLSNAKQEQTIDTSNQAVASAEMGVKYFSTDFQHEIGIIKSQIIEMTQNRIKIIVDCFNDGDAACDEQSELTALEDQIDVDMRSEYITLVVAKVTELELLKDIQKTPFPGEDAQYAISGTTIIKQNAAEEDVDLPSTTDKFIKSLRVELDLSGESKGTKKYLKGIFTVEVPVTFLSTSESLTIETKTVEDEDLKYDDMFFESWPTKTCAALMAEMTTNPATVFTECLLGPNEKASDFVDYLLDNDLDPKDYKIFTNNFEGNVCENSCNNMSLSGITVVVDSSATGLVKNSGNLNSFSSINLVVDGHLDPKNMNSLGKHGQSQTMVFRELTVTGNIEGGGLTNANLLILGKDYTETELAASTFEGDSRMDFQGNLTIGDNGRICFDLDRVDPDHVDKLARIATFAHDNTTGQIIYYTSDLTENRFYLTNSTGTVEDEARTQKYVSGFNKYTSFLSSCGIDVTNTTTEITDVPYPYILDPGFGLDVEY